MANIRFSGLPQKPDSHNDVSIPCTSDTDAKDYKMNGKQIGDVILNKNKNLWNIGQKVIAKEDTLPLMQYTETGSYSFADLTNNADLPDWLTGHNIGFATMFVENGTSNNSQKFRKYFIYYADLTRGTWEVALRGKILNGAGGDTNWHSSSQEAYSLVAGATVNGDVVAGQNWVNGKINSKATEINNYIIKTNNKIVGRNLIDVMGASSVQDCFQKIRALGTDYSKLQLGDYIDIPSITVDGIGTLQNASHNLRVEIAGFDHYYNVGDTATGRGILFTFRNCAFTHGMNSTNTNENGYYGCELRTILNGAFADGLENAIGISLKTVHRLAEKHSSSSWWTNWVAEKCFLPTEVEVLGHQVWGNAGYSTGTSVQYPIYAIDPSRRMKNYNGSRQYWWEGTSAVRGDNEQPSSTYFCYVGSYGYANNYNASDGYGVSPAFYI